MTKKQQQLVFIEELRLQIIKAKVSSLCESQRKIEENKPYSYDLKATLYTIGNFSSTALAIEENSAKEYFSV